MIKGIPQISVLVITYKQQDVIGRTLDSLLVQKDYLYEICVSDDCSPDNTWQILLEYQSRYPNLIKLHQNNPNVGIFKNFEQSWTMATGDVIYQVSGDDTIGEGWLQMVVRYIQINGIDYKNELFCIYGDYKCIYPNGDSIVLRNTAIEKCPDKALRLGIRNLISNRGCCFSNRIIKKFDNISQGRSHVVETAQDCQLQLNTEKNYYIPQLANIYYANIGVSTHVNDNYFQERLNIWPYLIKYLDRKGIKLCTTDINYGKFNVAMKKLRHKRSLVNFLKVIWTFVLSRDLSLPNGNGLRHLAFAIRRRFPHKDPIELN